MATIERKQSGFWLAKWCLDNGSRISKMTNHRDVEGALKQANHFEAVSRFWEAANSGAISFLAEMGFSPDFCHQTFPMKSHISMTDFRALLRDASITFKRPGEWRDGRNPTKKKYNFRRRSMTIPEALLETGVDITPSAVRSRLKSGWTFEDAVTKEKKK